MLKFNFNLKYHTFTMTVKKLLTYLSLGKISTKFIILTFIAVAAYVGMCLKSSTSVMSLKVDMFIKMRGVTVDIRTSSWNHSLTDSNNGTDIPKQAPRYKTDKKYRLSNFGDFSFKNGIHIENTQTKYNGNFDKDENGQSVKIHSGNTKKILPTTILDYDDNGKYPPNGISQIVGNVTKSSVSTENRNLNESELYSEENEKNKSFIDIFGNLANETDKRRKLHCNGCFPHNFNYVIENDICKLYDSEQTIELLILITTAHKNVKARTALRTTWLSFTRKNTASIRYAFLLGEQVEDRYNEMVVRENDAFHDIIMEDFIDSYMNLTYKTIMGFKWAATKCAHAEFVMKTDDDMFVNTPNVLKLIRGPLSDTLQTAIAGSCSQKARPIRNRTSKWYASLESYPQQFYPGFCSGTGYVTSLNVAAKIYYISPSVPFFHLEDVYVALCLRRLGFKLQGVPGFNAARPKMNPCLFKGPFLVTAHKMTPILLNIIWNRHCPRMPF